MPGLPPSAETPAAPSLPAGGAELHLALTLRERAGGGHPRWQAELVLGDGQRLDFATVALLADWLVRLEDWRPGGLR